MSSLVEHRDHHRDIGSERRPRRCRNNLDVIGVAVLDEADGRLDRARQLDLGEVGGLQVADRLVEHVPARRSRWSRPPRATSRTSATTAALGHDGGLGERPLQRLALRQVGGGQLVGGLGHGQSARFVEGEGDGLLGEMFERGHQEVLAGYERLDADRALTGDDAAVGDRLDDAGPLEVRLLAAMHVEQDPGVGELGQLGCTGGERGTIADDRPMPAEEPQVGAPLPQHAAGPGDELLAPRGSAGEEGEIGLTRSMIASPHVHRWRAAEWQMHGGQPPAMHGVEREAIDVEHHRAARRVRHGQVEERRAGLLGVDAHRCRGRSQSIGFRRRREDEELVWRDDEVLQRVIATVGQIVDHELTRSTHEHQRFHQVLGDLPHEDVAAPAHEHSAHRRPQYQWSLASTTISPRFSIITPVYDPPLGAFLACVDSVRSQTFGDWEWCLVDDCSTRPEVRRARRAGARRRSHSGDAPTRQRRNRCRLQRCTVDGSR